MEDLVTRAAAVAAAAHAGQLDRAGEPYLDHPRRVAASLSGDPLAQAAGWLHDVVEDSDITTADLVAMGFPEPVVHAVDLLTHRPDSPLEDYLAGIAADPLATRVKLADLADNSDPRRLAKLDPSTRARLTAKYATGFRALAPLGRPPADPNPSLPANGSGC
jgi:(p)ppGpp synthase/HD superfamily hydrolase